MSRNTVTRAQLTEAVYQEVGLSRNESADLVESVLAEISTTLAQGEMVKISSLAVFRFVRRVSASVEIRKRAKKCQFCRDGFWSSVQATC